MSPKLNSRTEQSRRDDRKGSGRKAGSSAGGSPSGERENEFVFHVTIKRFGLPHKVLEETTRSLTRELKLEYGNMASVVFVSERKRPDGR